MPGAFRIGTSGYRYDHWQPVFYPQALAKHRWFSHYASHFDTVEINNTFYRLPAAETFAKWRDASPPGFCFALKFSRYGTHFRRLRQPASLIGTFLERACQLGDRLGPILVQLPPGWNVNVRRLAEFLAAAPPRTRWAFEFRDPRWLCDDVYAVLREHQAALCIHDLIPEHPRVITASWTYWRFHGGAEHGGKYTADHLRAAAGVFLELLRRDIDAFVYFNNDVHGYAVQDAKELRGLIQGA